MIPWVTVVVVVVVVFPIDEKSERHDGQRCPEGTMDSVARKA